MLWIAYFSICSQSARCTSGAKRGADLALAGVRDLVVVHLDLDAHLLEREAHRGADVLQRVDRRHREVAALHRRAVAHVAALELLGGRPGGLGREHLAVAARHVDRPLDRVEDEELGLGAEVGDVAEAAGLQVRLGALGERARVALVALAVGRLDDVAGDVERRLVDERVEDRASTGRASAACRRPGCPSSRRSTSRRTRGPTRTCPASKYLAGTVTCCSLPRVSVKRRSTNLTSFSLIILRTAAPVADMRSPCR